MVHRIITFTFILFATVANSQPYNQVTFGGDLTGAGTTWNQQFLGPGTVTLQKQAALLADTLQCNSTNSAATPQACNPLAAANLMSAVISVQAATTTNITLSGVQVIDGSSRSQGTAILVDDQTTSSQNGIYIVQSGAWTRAINFPSGYVIAANCNLTVFVQTGTVNIGASFWLNTSSAITIGTSNQQWIAAPVANGSPTKAGLVKISVQGDVAAAVGSSISTVGDCASFPDLFGSVADQGNAIIYGTPGPCIVGDSSGNFLSALNSNSSSVSGTGCSSASANNTNNSGAITATGPDTCTLTFNSAFASAPFCSVGNVGPTVLAYLNALPGTGSAVFKTTAAGTFTYTCN